MRACPGPRYGREGAYCVSSHHTVVDRPARDLNRAGGVERASHARGCTVVTLYASRGKDIAFQQATCAQVPHHYFGRAKNDFPETAKLLHLDPAVQKLITQHRKRMQASCYTAAQSPLGREAHLPRPLTATTLLFAGDVGCSGYPHPVAGRLACGSFSWQAAFWQLLTEEQAQM